MIDDKIRIEALHKDIESFMEDIKRLQIKNAKLYEYISTLENYKERCLNALDYIDWHYDLGTKENIEFCLLRDRLLEILGDKE